jgi:hypothetical protein
LRTIYSCALVANSVTAQIKDVIFFILPTPFISTFLCKPI